MHFLGIRLSSIITNSSGEIKSHWKSHLWILISVRVFPSTANSTVQLSIAFVMMFMPL